MEIEAFSNKMAQMWDKIYGPKSDAEVSFYLCQVTKEGGLKGKTLDIGCGTGRFLLPMLEKGYAIEGVEPSVLMVAVLNQKAESYRLDPVIHVVPFSDFQAKYLYAGVTSFNFFPYIVDDKMTYDFLENVFKILEKNGVFVFNYYNVYEYWDNKGWSDIFLNINERGFSRIESFISPIDFIYGIVKEELYCFVVYDGISHVDCYARKIRFRTKSEVSFLLEKIGFDKIVISSGINNFYNMDKRNKIEILYVVTRK